MLNKNFRLKHEVDGYPTTFDFTDMRSARIAADVLMRKEHIDYTYRFKQPFPGVTQTLYIEENHEWVEYKDSQGRTFHETHIGLDEVYFFYDPKDYDIVGHAKKMGIEMQGVRVCLGVTAELDSTALWVSCVRMALFAGDLIPAWIRFGSSALVVSRTVIFNRTHNPNDHFLSVLLNAANDIRVPSAYNLHYSVEAVNKQNAVQTPSPEQTA